MRFPYFLLFVLSFLWARPALPVSNMPFGQHILVAEAAPPIEPTKAKKVPIEPKRKARKADFFDAFWWWVVALAHGSVVAMTMAFYFDILFAAVMTSLATSLGFVLIFVGILALGGLLLLWARNINLEVSPKIYGGFVLLMAAMTFFAFFWVGLGLGLLWFWLVGLVLFLGAAGGFMWLIDGLRDGDFYVSLIFLLGLCLAVAGLAVSIFFSLTGYSIASLVAVIILAIAFLFSTFA